MSNMLFQNVIANIKKEKLLSISNILVMTLTFLILGFFVNLVVYSQTAIRVLEEQVQVTAYFKDDVPEAKIFEYQKKFEGDLRISDVSYVSKEDAFKIFVDINKDEPVLLESISASILPASLEIKAKDIGDLSLIASEVEAMDGVEEVKYFKDVVERFKYWSTVASLIGFVLMAIFLVISYSIILVTFRTTINSKGPEYEILKLVGASDSYVKSPLIYQGVFFGGVSALIAGLVITLTSLFTKVMGLFAGGLYLAFIYGFQINSLVFSLILSILLVVSGILLGYFGSTSAIKKYLKY
jgi:cell division transport system permease protein